MKIILYTVIKNEIEEDVKQWIDYHLSLGIDEIYIFEDYDSNPHLSLYNLDNVRVMNISELVSEEDKEKCRNKFYLPGTPKFSFQGMYMRRIIDFLIKKGFDWSCYFDIDEYITPNGDLKSILSHFKAHQALKIPCVIYNANGHIKRPQGLIIDNYKEIVEDSKFRHQTKMFINMQKYTPDMQYNHHICIKGDYVLLDKDVIYYRHYITKSFEDWVYKINVRKQFNNSKRMDHFFLLNPNMNKDELLKLL